MFTEKQRGSKREIWMVTAGLGAAATVIALAAVEKMAPDDPQTVPQSTNYREAMSALEYPLDNCSIQLNSASRGKLVVTVKTTESRAAKVAEQKWGNVFLPSQGPRTFSYLAVSAETSSASPSPELQSPDMPLGRFAIEQSTHTLAITPPSAKEGTGLYIYANTLVNVRADNPASAIESGQWCGTITNTPDGWRVTTAQGTVPQPANAPGM